MNADLSIEQQLRKLEERLLQPDVRKSAPDIDALLADGFAEFGSSGRIFDKPQSIERMRTEAPVRRSLVDFKTRPLAPGVILATYRAIRPGAPGEAPIASLRSSIWKSIDGRWQLVFHQGTRSTARNGQDAS
jgi:hypothetical protein